MYMYTCKYMKQVIRLKGVGTQRGHECVQYHKEISISAYMHAHILYISSFAKWGSCWSKTMVVHGTHVYTQGLVRPTCNCKRKYIHV